MQHVSRQSIAHGVIRLSKQPRTYGIIRRQIEILKIRGSGFRGGLHDYNVDGDGLHVFPRLIAAEHPADSTEESLPGGVIALDLMFGGGVERGASTLVLGPTGVGKSSIVMPYLQSAANREEKSYLYSFDESTRTARVRAKSIGMQIEGPIASGHLVLRQVDPAELSPREFVTQIGRAVDDEQARVIVIDSLNGFLHAMTGESDLPLQLHELLTYLGARRIVPEFTSAEG